jgi:hypothetical protein
VPFLAVLFCLQLSQTVMIATFTLIFLTIYSFQVGNLSQAASCCSHDIKFDSQVLLQA